MYLDLMTNLKDIESQMVTLNHLGMYFIKLDGMASINIFIQLLV